MNQALQKKRIVVIGGGTGSVAVLSALKKYPDFDLSVIVGMADDGGSNEVVRDVFGLLPLSDLRKSIIALSESHDELLQQLFTYRFSKGDGLSGHTLGNLIMTALSDVTGSEIQAVEAACRLFQVRGSVIPVTLDHVALMARYDDGKVIQGEHIIDEPLDESNRRIVELSLTPQAEAYSEAVHAIESADMIVFGPGDLYTTTLATVVVNGIAEAVQKSSAKNVFVMNLMTKKGQTHGMAASDLVRELTRYVGRAPDVVLVNNYPLPIEAVSHYAEKGERPIVNDLPSDASYRVIAHDMVWSKIIDRETGDTLDRSLVRHDPEKLGTILHDLV
jgi:uncharacterized cofD-like protein